MFELDSTNHVLNTDKGLGLTPSTHTYRDLVGLSDPNDLNSLSFGGRSSSNLMLNSFSIDEYAPLIEGFDPYVLVNRGEDITGSNFNSVEAGYAQTNWDTYLSPQPVDWFGLTGYSAQPSHEFGNGNSSTQTTDWFSQNLIDPQLITKARTLAADSQFNRNDMMAIFRDAKDGNVIDANELKDLRTLVSNANRFNIPDDVRVLSNKIVNGNAANIKYQGQNLGNLFAGSTGDQMEKLIGKWFLGSDRPTIPTNYTYRQANGYLFQNGVSYQDVKQGGLADCYFMAGLAEVALHSPSKIQSMFTDNGDNTYTVRFYNSGVADYVTVDKYLPTNSSGNFVYAQQAKSDGGNYKDLSNELWVALAEKAYAQVNESGWIGQDNTNSYLGIEYGADNKVITHVTGRNASSSSLDFNSMVNAYKAGNLMGVSSYNSGVASNIAPNHVYVVTNYDSFTQQFTLYNPWGLDGGNYEGKFKPGTIKLSFNELKASFASWSYTT
ncbi:peptidase C2 calpain [Scytonema hofmannii PCC 7110]|uniref:Peptidase C2 calpain n=1 Tax=Scytonema hofmannii PCC 7110 TaxID=128403 RepID=A0A139X1T8_9CYAN|nr:C2 family cysteine protease [Scytonema hofmannii]KYC38655.1 peptidase C2 calpain [Scytonema hofmannii PCC 7110]